MNKKFCCEDLERFTTENKEEFYDTNKFIYFNEKFDEFGFIIHDGGQSYVGINYCPWSGDKLPSSKRLQWFDELEKLGYEDPIEDFEQLPEEYKSNEWLKKYKE